MRVILAGAVALGAVASPAAAEDPDEVSGMEIKPDEDPSTLREVGRAVLLIPRAAIEVVSAPIRGALYLEERYHVAERTKRLLFNDAETIGAYPIAEYRSGFGISGGAKAVHLDMFGAAESGSVKALYGGRYDQEYGFQLDSGDRFDRLTLGLEGEAKLRPKERFFGIGNGDLVPAESVTAPVDPTVDETAVATRYRESAFDLRLGLDLDLGAGFATAVRGSLERREVESSDELSGDAALTDIYDPAVLMAGADLDSGYAELEVRFDTREPTSRFASAAMPGRGVLVAGQIGYNRGLGDGPERDYLRYTADLQAYFDLYRGTRVIGLRLLASQIDADYVEIPFVYLPRLGGDTLLRGYQTDRFYDRGLTLASAEYKWEVAPRYIAVFAFTDVGRVQRDLLDPELDDLRVGFGAGLQLHTLESFLVRAQIASSIDGGVFLNVDFDPVSEQRVRDEP